MLQSVPEGPVTCSNLEISLLKYTEDKEVFSALNDLPIWGMGGQKVKSLELKEDTLLHLSTRFTASIAKRMGNSSTSISKPEAIKMVKEAISENCVVIFSKTTCPYCTMAKEAFDKINVSYKTVELDKIEHGNQLQAVLHKMTGARTVPRVFINGRCIGGGTETKNLGDEGKLLHLVQQCNISAETS